MRVPSHAAVAATVDLAAGTVGNRVTGLVNAVLRKVAARTWYGVGGRAQRRPRRPARRWRCAPRTRPGSSTRTPTCCRPRSWSPRCWPTTCRHRSAWWSGPDCRSVDALLAAGAEPALWSPYAARWSGNPADLAAVRDGTRRRPGRGVAAGGRGAWRESRRRRRRVGGWICAPGRAASPPCSPDWRPSGRPGWWPPRSPRTGRDWSRRDCAATRSRRRCWWPTAPDRPGTRGRSTGCWPTCRAPVWVRCGAGPSRAGGGRQSDVEELHPLQVALLDVRARGSRPGRRGRVRDLLTAPPGDRRRGRPRCWPGAPTSRSCRPPTVLTELPPTPSAAVPAAVAAPARHRRDVRGLSEARPLSRRSVAGLHAGYQGEQRSGRGTTTAMRIVQVGLGGFGRDWARHIIPQVPEVEVVGTADLFEGSRNLAIAAGLTAPERCFSQRGGGHRGHRPGGGAGHRQPGRARAGRGRRAAARAGTCWSRSRSRRASPKPRS